MDLSYYDDYRHNIEEASDFLNRFFRSIVADSTYGDYIAIEKGRVCYMMKIYEKIAKYNDDGSIYDIEIWGPGLKIVYTDNQLNTVETLEWSKKIELQHFITNNTTTSDDDSRVYECDQQPMIDIVQSLYLR